METYKNLSDDQKKKISERKRLYYLEHKEEIKARVQEYAKTHKPQRRKRLADRWKTDEEYRKQRTAEIKTRIKKYAAENKAYVEQYKLTHTCVLCPVTDPDFLQFHHLRDKKFNITNALKGRCSLETLKQELEKCEVLCANCHQKHHKTHRE